MKADNLYSDDKDEQGKRIKEETLRKIANRNKYFHQMKFEDVL